MVMKLILKLKSAILKKIEALKKMKIEMLLPQGMKC